MINLNGKWKFRQTDKDRWYDAQVPGCNYLDLMAEGVIGDPFVSDNEEKVQWIHDKNFEYIKKFEVSKNDLKCDHAYLNCKMLDTISEIYINHSLIGRTKNCFIPYIFEIKDKLREGENEIRIIFKSAKKYVEQKYSEEPTPVNANGQNGIVHIRKPQYHFGWDWGPVLTPCGISGDIYIDFKSADYIKNFDVKYSEEGGTYVISAVAEIARISGASKCKITLTSPDGKSVSQSGESAVFTVDEPELWWTKELSGKDEQPLYTVTCELTEKRKVSDTAAKKIGLRTIELYREKDEYGYNFQFRLNGVKLFIKGANYIPDDSFMTRFDSSRLEKLLDAVQFSNMNMLRVWGGGFYASDDMLDECDRRGILIWQDFMFACQAYPFFDFSFLENVKDEVEYNVKRLSSHPCLAVFCGNNEIEDMHMSWLHMPKYIEWTEKFFYHILPEEIVKYNDFTPYTPTSPVGTKHNENVGSDFVGDTHLWGVWHGLQPMTYYRKRMTRFCSEFGFESMPDMKTVKTFATPDEYALSSKVMKAHQKCKNGNDKMLYYMASRFNLPNNLEDIIYLSQVTQQECIADATEHWRRNKGRCNGSMYWQLNDCWQTCSWSSYDYFGNYKALQYKARHFNAPLTVSIEDRENDADIYVINDYNEEKSGVVEYCVFDFENGIIHSEKKEYRTGAVENELVFCVSFDGVDKTKCGICAILYDELENEICRKTALLLPEKKLNLPKANLKVSAKEVHGFIKIEIESDNYARLVKLENISSNPFSDNFFDLLPNQKYIVTQKAESDSLAQLQISSLAAKSICDVKNDVSKANQFVKRAKVFFSPTNISNALYHGRVPKENE